MRIYLLYHHHEPEECAVSFAAWHGSKSPLRGRDAVGSCLTGGHEIWWRVRAADEDAALALLPKYVANRTAVSEVRIVRIP